MFEPAQYIDGDPNLRLPGMDPRFPVTREELYSLQMDVKHIQIVQSNHAERLSKLEKRQTDDAVIKSVWSSPFPTALVGTPQQGPVHLPSHVMFDDLDEHGEHLLGSLHLGPAEEEPVRRGAASRANSVRFDESALQGSGWAASNHNNNNNNNNNNRHSVDFAGVRPGGGLLMERSSSHKSDGRHSSAGHSVHSHHSVASGRASSLGLDAGFSAEATGRGGVDSPVEFMEPPPGLFILGSVPSIIRCWLTTNFRSKTLLYAVVCTGAQKSTVDGTLLRELDLLDEVQRDTDGANRIRLPVYLAEAIPRPGTPSRSSSPTPVPSILANLEVTGLDQADDSDCAKGGIRIFLGSDTLRAHSADILFSQNQMSVYTSDRAKFMVPFVRPEDDALYRHLTTANPVPERPRLNATAAPFVSDSEPTPVFDRPGSLPPNDGLSGEAAGASGVELDAETENSRTYDVESLSALSPFQDASGISEVLEPNHLNQTEKNNDVDKPGPASDGTEPESACTKLGGPPSESSIGRVSGGSTGSAGAESYRRESATGIWGSWRHGGTGGPGGDGTLRENSSLSGYQPAGRGRNMKVLRPQKSGIAGSVKTGAAYEAAPPPKPSGGSDGGTSGTNGNEPTGSKNGATTSGNLDQRRKSQIGLIGGERASSSPFASSSTSLTASCSGGSRREQKRNATGGGPPPRENKDPKESKENGRSTNPIGGASAFSWMKGKTQTATAD